MYPIPIQYIMVKALPYAEKDFVGLCRFPRVTEIHIKSCKYK